jgi:hypothetical protein
MVDPFWYDDDKLKISSGLAVADDVQLDITNVNRAGMQASEKFMAERMNECWLNSQFLYTC